VAALDAVSGRLDTDTLRGLNARVDATGSIRSTATRWLDDEQLP
jgi:glycine betaine/choline ABC-type transport system substrate-binding protein